MCRTACCWVIWVAIALLGVAVTVWAQPEDVRARMAEVLRYTGIENPSPDDVARMAQLWTRAQQPGLAREERRLTFRDMYVLYNKLQGRDLGARPQTLDGITYYLMSIFQCPRR